MHMSRIRSIAAAACLSGLLLACGDEAPDADATQAGGTPKQAATPKPSAAAAAAEATRGMVSGVTNTSKPGAPVDLKFELKARPEAGQPLPIEIALVPRVASESLRATFIATDGLTVHSGGPAEYAKAQAAAVYRHTLTVVPREDGVYYLSAIVLMDMPNGPEARTFSIPVIVGAPQEDLGPAGKSAPPVDGTGQPIQSMPAQQG